MITPPERWERLEHLRAAARARTETMPNYLDSDEERAEQAAVNAAFQSLQAESIANQEDEE